METPKEQPGEMKAPYVRPQLKRFGAAAELTAFTLKKGNRDGDMGGTKRTF
ncbi:MAG: hypothetical protein ACKVS7_09070 [Gemmatimonadaceae bacterium]